MTATVTTTAYVVSRLPDPLHLDAHAFSPRVEAAGRGKWAVRLNSMCLNLDGRWEWELSPSSRTKSFLARCRWDSAEGAIQAAILAEPHIRRGDATAADVLADWDEIMQWDPLEDEDDE